MSQRMVEKFNGKPITELNWRELLQYNQALNSLISLSGNIDGGKAASVRITWEYETVKKEEDR